MKTNYSYNAITNTLTVSAAFLKNAANLHSKEYEIIRTLRADHGEITIVTEERRKSAWLSRITARATISSIW